ncbi:MAG TPA: NAD(P)/FAD-dependent oxidoreductase [Bryobacteraceae bacterium]|nr:NAD(P)/FAD-dependent oxidoreductase [Bryobacteraceae bacterium]
MRSFEPDVDVVIVGAGVAGLAAAVELEKAGLRLAIFEARDRIGGRILTYRDPLSPLPIELGAEFVHGQAPEILGIANRVPIPLCDVAWNPVERRAGEWRTDVNLETESESILEEAVRYRGPDMTWADFAARSKASASEKTSATRFVEGFNAARADRISLLSIQQDTLAARAMGDERQFRIPSGYDRIPRFLADRLETAVRLCSPVRQIAWTEGQVEIDGELKARAAVITLPVGVLQAGSVVFEPVPAPVKAASDIERGHVFRVVLRFDDALWERVPELADAGFVFTDSEPFPTWWTTLPMRAPIITAWCAGPHVDGLPDSSEQIARGAIKAFGELVGEKVEAHVRAWYLHNWRDDPWARCAYSYARAGRLAAREELATPVDKTLFFAGEAAETEGHSGTVHGAIRSGRRAAARILTLF